MADRVIRYRGEFDASNILASLKNIRAEMQKNGADSALFGNVDKDIQKAESLMRDLLAQIKTGFRNLKDIDNFEKKFLTLNLTLSKVNVGLGDIAKPENFKILSKELDNLNKQIQKNIQAQEELGKAAKEAAEGFKVKGLNQELTAAIEKGEKLEETLKRVAQQLFTARQGTMSKYASKADDSTINSAMSKIGGDINFSSDGLGKYLKALKEIVIEGKNVKEVFDNFRASLNDNDKELLESTDLTKQYIEDIKKFLAQLKTEVPSEERKNIGNAEKAFREMTYGGTMSVDGGFLLNKDTVGDITKLEVALNNIVPLLEKLKLLEAELAAEREKNANIAVNGLTAAGNALNRVAEETDKATLATREQMAALEATNRTFDNIKNTITRLTSLTAIVSTVTREIKETAHIIQDLDKAFGLIAMVTDYSIEDMWSKYQSYADLANKLGQSTLSVVQASGLYFLQGLEEAEALQLTESTMKLATLAGLDFLQATSLMTSAVRGFHMEMSEGEHVTDVYSELAAHAAASVEGIANAMSRTAAIASSAGMEFETTAAMLTTMIEATQESPETLGTAMKTVIARFTELKNNVSALDSEFDDLDYNKVDKALKSIGVSLKDTNGLFRDIDDVFLEVSERWDTLDRNTLRYIATTAAGSRQQSRFIALMENYDRTMELIGTALDSAGRSSELFAKYLDTLENKVNRLKNSWEQLRLLFLKNDFLKTAVGLLNSLVTSMNKVDPKKLLGFGVIGIAIGKNIALNLVDNISKGMKDLKGKLSTAWGKVFTKIYEEKTNIIVEKYTEKLNAVKTEQEKINKELNDLNVKLNEAKQDYEGTNNSILELEIRLQEIKNKIAEQGNEENKITEELKEQLKGLESALNESKEELKVLEQELIAEEKRTEEIKKRQNISNKKVTDLQGKINTAQGNLDENTKAASEMISLVGSAVSSGLFVGITTFLASKDTKASILAAGGTLVASLGPILLEKAVTAGLEKLAASTIITAAAPVITAAIPVLAGVAVVAAATAFVGYEIWYNSEELKLKRKIKEDKEELKRLSELASDREDLAEKAEEEFKDLDTLYSKWKELNNIKLKSTNLQEEFNKLNDELALDYPELVKNYNEETHELLLLTDLLEELLKKLREKKLLSELESILTNARTAAQEVELKNDKNKLKLDKINKQIDLQNAVMYDVDGQSFIPNIDNYKKYIQNQDDLANALGIGKDSTLKDNNLLAFVTTKLPNTNIHDLDTIQKYLDDYITTYDSLAELKEKLDKKIANSEKRKWNAILDTSEESLRKYYGDTESTNAAIDIARKNAEKGAENLKNLSMKDKNLAASTYKNVSSYTTREMFNEWSDGEQKVGLQDIDKIKTREDSYNFFKVLADYNNKNIDDFLAEIDKSEKTWEDLWKDYKEAIISGYMSAAPLEIINEVGEDGAELYNNFIGKLSGLSSELLINIDNNDLEKSYKIPPQLIENAREAMRQLLEGNENNRIEFKDIFGDINYDSFTGEAYNALKTALQKIIDLTNNSNLAEGYLKEMGNLFKDKLLNSSQINLILSSTDFTNINPLNIDEFKEELINFFKSLGIDGAEKFYEEWANTAKQYSLWNDVLDEDEIEAFTEDATKLLDKISELMPDIFSWAKEADFKGFKIVESSDIDKIRELGETLGINIDSMYELDKETGLYKLNIKDLYNTAIKSSSNYITILDKTIELLKELKKVENDNNKIESIESLINELETLKNSLSYTTDLIQAQEQDWKDYTNLVNIFNTSLSNLTSNYETLSKEMIDNGHVSLDSIDSLTESLKGIDELLDSLDGFKKLDASSFFYKNGNSIGFAKDKLKDYIDSMIKAMEVLIEEGKSCDILAYYKLVALKESFLETTKSVNEYSQSVWDTYNSDVQSKYEEWQEALEKIKEKEEAVAEAEEKVKEAEEELLETEEKLQEIYYGEANHKNKLDYLYNYTTELEQLEKKAKDAAEALDNLSPDDDVHQKVEDYVTALRNEVTNYKALNEIIKQYMENQKRMLDEGLSLRLEQLKAEGAVDTSTNVSDFYYERNGRFYIDYSKLNAAKLPDDVSDFIEQLVENLNKYGEAYESNLDKIETALKEFLDWQKAARDKLIATENKVIEILKKQDLEELDNLKEKYDGMKAADDDYTSALEESIKKQRDLRNLASQWDDLAEKEKKLSLQLRDTSGANAKEIKKTQEDIAKTRESLLDSAVDNIINNLKELYEEQEETRQAEIEYRLAILDNKNYVDEATAIINNWGSVEEAKAWFMKFDEEFINASDATIAKLLEDYEGYYNNTVEYTEAMGISYEDIINLTSEEIEEKVRETSETLTEESERALDETMVKVHEAQEKGREEVEAAEKAVEDAKNKVVEATRAVAEALEEARKKLEAYNEAIRNQPPGGGGNGGNGGDGSGGNGDSSGGNGDGSGGNGDSSGPTELQKETSVRSALASLSQGYKNNADLLEVANIAKLTKEEVIDIIKTKIASNPPHHGYMSNYAVHWASSIEEAYKLAKGKGFVFKKGGLVDYTGPAWVDGTPSKPEAFLSASDTEMIREFIDLQKLTFTRPSTDSFTRTNNYGDPVFNIDINVDSISSDYDVDRLVERVHEDILSITSAPGQSVILSK